jgi:hypothetical protein
MTIAALRLKHSPGQATLLEHLSKLLPADFSPGETSPSATSPGDISPGENGSCQAHLCLLGGFVYGLLVQHAASSQEWLEMLHEHLQSYLNLVMKMSAGDCTRLAGQLRTVFTSVAEAPGS